MPAANLPRSLRISGKMHIKTGFGNQPLHVNGFCIFFSGSMIQNLRRNNFLKLHIYRNGMSLVCPDQRLIFIKRIPLFLILSYNLLSICILNVRVLLTPSINSDTLAHPCSSSVIPMTSGLCLRIIERNLLVLLCDMIPSFLYPGNPEK